MTFDDPTIVPCFDSASQYVITRDDYRAHSIITKNTLMGFSLININERSIQHFVKAKSTRQGFCITTGGGFDFHFTSTEEEDDGNYYNYHHSLSFCKDAIEIMK